MTNKEAIEIFTKVKALPCGWCYEGGDEFRQALDLAIKALEERPQGKWIKQGWGYICSECGESNDYAYDDNIHKFTDKFCPNCGARMEADDDN